VAELSVVDASPVICLAGAGLLHLLQMEGPRVVLPRVVAEEVTRGARGSEVAEALKARSWIGLVDCPPPPAEVLAWDLGADEAAVLTWANLHPGAVAILDDREARRCAKALGIPLHGTLGLALLARKRGLVPSARPIVDRLRSAGLYLSDGVVDQALALVGE
jgi:predicted nucleic acid-binding protein